MPFEIQSKKWLKTPNSILYKCFRKVRVVNNDRKKDDKDKLLHERMDLKKDAELSTISVEIKIPLSFLVIYL